MKNCDSKLQKSVCGNTHTNFRNPLHAARSPSSLDVAIQFVTNLTIRGISAGITVIPDARAWPLAAVHARRRRTLCKRGKQSKTEFAREIMWDIQPRSENVSPAAPAGWSQTG